MNRCPLTLRAWLAACVLLVGTNAGVAAEPRDPLADLSPVDDLTLAQAAVRLGDDPVLARLSASNDPLPTLVAVRAAPFLRAPEQALDPLIRLAAGRDPDLAEAASRSVRQIVQDARLAPGARFESAADAWGAARTSLGELAKDATLRSDLKQRVLESLALLAATAG